MARSPRQALERLRQLARAGELATFCRAHAVDLLVAHGAVTRPDTLGETDLLELAVVLDMTADTDLSRLAPAFGDLAGCAAVALLDLERADALAQRLALVGTVPLYERDPGTLATIRDRGLIRRDSGGWPRSTQRWGAVATGT